MLFYVTLIAILVMLACSIFTMDFSILLLGTPVMLGISFLDLSSSKDDGSFILSIVESNFSRNLFFALIVILGIFASFFVIALLIHAIRSFREHLKDKKITLINEDNKKLHHRLELDNFLKNKLKNSGIIQSNNQISGDN